MSEINNVTAAIAATAPSIPLWLEFLRAIAPIAGALIVAAVAWKFGDIQAQIASRQAETAKEKLRLDLFEKRLAVYESALAYVGSMSASGDSSPEAEIDYFRGTNPAKWLFGDEVEDYLGTTLWHLATDLHLANEELKCARSFEDRKRIAQHRGELFKQVTNQFSVM